MLDAVEAHADRFIQAHVVATRVVAEMARRRHPPLVSLIDQDPHLLRRRLLDLDAPHPPVRPVVHLGPDLSLRDPVRPTRAVVLCRLDAVLAAERPEVRPRSEQPRPDRLAPVDAVPRLDHPVWDELTTRPRRRHPVRQEEDRVVRDVLGPSLADEVHVQVRVQVDHPRQDRHVVVQIDHARAGRRDAP